MSRWYRRPESAIRNGTRGTLRDTKQRLQVSILGSLSTHSNIDDAVRAAFPDRGVDYTVFCSDEYATETSTRFHNSQPKRIRSLALA